MGIFNFFTFFKNRFTRHIYKMQNSINEISDGDIHVHNLLIDFNGLIHNSTQKVYKYGNFKPTYPVLIKENRFTQQKVHEEVCNSIEQLLITVNPSKRLIICTDGVAPFSKQSQQRSRRFKSSLERSDDDTSFDSTKITPGTEFMDYLSKYVDWFIKKRISENPLWEKLEVIFSNEKVPNEGEQKIMNYLRKFGDKNEVYCVHGLDADLIMLALSSHFPNFYIIREDMFDRHNNYYFLDIGNARKEIIEIMKWEPEPNFKQEKTVHSFRPEYAINDFVFLCFLVGNDFLHYIPSLEIVENGIEVIFDVSRNVGKTHGHVTFFNNGQLTISKHAFKKFMEIIADFECTLLENKFRNRTKYFEDELLARNAEYHDIGGYKINIDKYRSDYIETHFIINDENQLELACKEYLLGLQWILTYYSSNILSWTWSYKFHYSPLASSLIKYIDEIEYPPRFHKGLPTMPFLQLMNILPPKSADILPKPLNNILKTNLDIFYPPDTKIDVSGKKHEYQGVVLLPHIDHKFVKKLYDKNIKNVEMRDSRRNVTGKTLVYKRDDTIVKYFKSFYGDIKECRVKTSIIEI